MLRIFACESSTSHLAHAELPRAVRIPAVEEVVDDRRRDVQAERSQPLLEFFARDEPIAIIIPRFEQIDHLDRVRREGVLELLVDRRGVWTLVEVEVRERLSGGLVVQYRRQLLEAERTRATGIRGRRARACACVCV